MHRQEELRRIMAPLDFDKLVSFCQVCGEAIYPPHIDPIYEKPHVCPEPEISCDNLPYLVNQLLSALVNAEGVIDQTHPDPERGIARVKRMLRQFRLTDKDRLWYRLRTSAENPATEW